MDTIFINSAEIEMAYNSTNNIVTIDSSLTVRHISDLMAISTYGKSLRLFIPKPYVKTFLRNHCSASKPLKSSVDNKEDK